VSTVGVLWTGICPGLRLFEGEESTAWAGLCRVDWSIRGTGAMLGLWQGDDFRVVATSRTLAEWLTETFIAPMWRSAALGGVTWRSITYETAAVEVTVDLDSGLRARAGDIEFELAEPQDRQLIYRDAYALDGATYWVSFVNVSCGQGRLAVGGRPLPGQPRRWTDDQGRLRSTAQLTVAETWAT